MKTYQHNQRITQNVTHVRGNNKCYTMAHKQRIVNMMLFAKVNSKIQTALQRLLTDDEHNHTMSNLEDEVFMLVL